MAVHHLYKSSEYYWMNRLARCRQFQESMASDHQLDEAVIVLKGLGEPARRETSLMVADALAFAVDALCNLGDTPGARALAGDTCAGFELSMGLSGASPLALGALQAERTRAHAAELDGDPDEALERLTELDDKVRHIGGTRVVDQERLRILRGIQSAAKREGSAIARRYAAIARRAGDPLARALESWDPQTASRYYHRSALQVRSVSERHAANQEAIDLLERSLPLRPDTPRDRCTRGMADGELLVLRGEREAGVMLFTQTVNGMRGVLPRHERSAREHLGARDLLAA